MSHTRLQVARLFLLLLVLTSGIRWEMGLRAQAQPNQDCVFSATMSVDTPVMLLGATARVTNTVATTCQPQKADIILVLDDSGSTSPSTREILVASRDFIDRLDLPNRPNYRMGLVIFSNTIATSVPLTRDPDVLQRSLRLRGTGETDIALGLREARRLFDGKPDAIEIVVLVSDGHNGATCQPVTREAGGLGDDRHAVCLGVDCNSQCMRSVASSPSLYYEARSGTQLEEVYNRIAAKVSGSSVQVMNELESRIAYKGNAKPGVRRERRRIYWDAVPVPIELAFDIEPQEVGTYRIADDAWMEYTDDTGKLRRMTIDSPLITVMGSCDPNSSSLQGKITINGHPVQGATVAYNGPAPNTTVTDADGFYRMADLSNGRHMFWVSRPGSPMYASEITLHPGCNVKSVDLGTSFVIQATWPLNPENHTINTYFDHEYPVKYVLPDEEEHIPGSMVLFGGSKSTTAFYSGHNGLDIDGNSGDPVYAIADGTVTKVNSVDSGGYGKYVILKHRSDLYTLYAHLSTTRVAKEDRVTRSQIIGDLGCTGRCSGDHLHFEVITSDGTGADNYRADAFGWDPPVEDDPWYQRTRTVSVPIFQGRRPGDQPLSLQQAGTFDPVFQRQVLVQRADPIQINAPDGSFELKLPAGSFGGDLTILKVTRLFEAEHATHEALTPTLTSKSISSAFIAAHDASSDSRISALLLPASLTITAPLNPQEGINANTIRLVQGDRTDIPLEATVVVSGDNVTVTSIITSTGRFRIVGDHVSVATPTKRPTTTPIPTVTAVPTVSLTTTPSPTAATHVHLYLPIARYDAP